MSVSNTVDALTYTTPIPAGNIYVGPGQFLGEYSSLNLVGKSDRETKVTYEFSGDNVNWDAAMTKTLEPFSNTNTSVVIVAKYCRIVIENLDLTDQTFLRVYTYGSDDNSAINALIQKIGSLNAVLDVGNAPVSKWGDVPAADVIPVRCYSFDSGLSTLITQGITSGYRDLRVKSHTGTGTSAQVDFTNGILLSNGNEPDEATVVETDKERIHMGCAMVARFTARFNVVQDSTLGIQIAAGIASPGGGARYGFGFFSTNNNTINPQQIQIVILDPQVGVIVLRKSEWNGDRADGTALLPPLNFLSNQEFEISYTYAGNIVFRISNPSTGYYVTVHTFRKLNDSQNAGVPGGNYFGMRMNVTIVPGSVVGPGVRSGVEVMSYSLTSMGKRALHRDPFSTSGSVSGEGPGIVDVLNLRNSTDLLLTTFPGCFPRLKIKSLNVVDTSGHTTPLQIFVYKNPVFLIPGVWTQPDPNSNAERSSGNGYVVPPSPALYNWTIPSDGTLNYTFDPPIHMDSSDDVATQGDVISFAVLGPGNTGAIFSILWELA